LDTRERGSLISYIVYEEAVLEAELSKLHRFPLWRKGETSYFIWILTIREVTPAGRAPEDGLG